MRKSLHRACTRKSSRCAGCIRNTYACADDTTRRTHNAMHPMPAIGNSNSHTHTIRNDRHLCQSCGLSHCITRARARASSFRIDRRQRICAAVLPVRILVMQSSRAASSECARDSNVCAVPAPTFILRINAGERHWHVRDAHSVSAAHCTTQRSRCIAGIVRQIDYEAIVRNVGMWFRKV